MKFNNYGNLEGGIVKDISLQKIEDFLVNNFQSSKTRQRNFKGLIDFIQEDVKWEYVSKLWINGSFCSNKINPNDIDLIIFLKINTPSDFYNEIIQKRETLLLNHHLDTYPAIDPDSFTTDLFMDEDNREVYNQFNYHRQYWKGQFGFDRNDRPKGILELKEEDIDDKYYQAISE